MFRKSSQFMLRSVVIKNCSKVGKNCDVLLIKHQNLLPRSFTSLQSVSNRKFSNISLDNAIKPSEQLTVAATFDIFSEELPTNANSPQLLKIRHSSSHVMAMAVQRLFPKVQVTIGPWIEDG